LPAKRIAVLKIWPRRLAIEISGMGGGI